MCWVLELLNGWAHWRAKLTLLAVDSLRLPATNRKNYLGYTTRKDVSV